MEQPTLPYYNGYRVTLDVNCHSFTAGNIEDPGDAVIGRRLRTNTNKETKSLSDIRQSES